jgi:uncharacterized protein (TIGR02271 family)
MAVQDDFTTLVCLFHHQNQAQAAVEDLLKAGLPEASVSRYGGNGTEDSADPSFLSTLGVPERDEKHLYEGVRNGGSLVAVRAESAHVSKVEDIFGKHRAEQIDEADVEHSPVASAAETVIPVVEEELVVGKRTVDQGGVRVYRRIVEIPVEESVNLREERISIDRELVDRPATDADAAFIPRTIELTETAEEVVVGKSARVVEEVLVGKDVSSHTEHIQDTVRHTEIEIEEVEPVAEPGRRIQ